MRQPSIQDQGLVTGGGELQNVGIVFQPVSSSCFTFWPKKQENFLETQAGAEQNSDPHAPNTWVELAAEPASTRINR